MDPAIIGAIILVISIVLYITEVIPLTVTTILCALAMGVTGAASLKTVFSGWSNNVLLMDLGMLIVGDTLFATGAAHYFGKKMVKVFGRSAKFALISIIIVTAVISAFLNNAATVAMMLPIVGSACAASDGKLKKKYLFMPVSFAAVAGGGMTLIGTPCNIVAQGFLEGAGLPLTSFWEWSLLALPRVILLVIWFATVGGKWMEKICTFPEVPDEGAVVDHSVEPKFTFKMLMSVLILAFCVVCFAFQIWNIGIVAMIAAALCFVTRCANYKETIKRLDWNTVLLVGFILGYAACLNESGAGTLIADLFVKVVGADVNHMVVLVIVGVLASFLGNCISHTPSVSILAPICLAIAPAIGMSGRSLVIATACFATIVYTTPTCTPSQSMSLVAGYRYMDYVKLGGVINVISVVVMLIIFPLLYPLAA